MHSSPFTFQSHCTALKLDGPAPCMIVYHLLSFMKHHVDPSLSYSKKKKIWGFWPYCVYLGWVLVHAVYNICQKLCPCHSALCGRVGNIRKPPALCHVLEGCFRQVKSGLHVRKGVQNGSNKWNAIFLYNLQLGYATTNCVRDCCICVVCT